MGKFLSGLITGVVLIVLGVFILLFVALRFRDRPPDIASNSVLVMRLEGGIPERAPVDVPFISDNSGAVTISNLWMALRKAAVDPHIKAVVLEPAGLDAGWAKLQEIRSDIEQFRKSGKPVFAFLRQPGTREYYVATAADRIYLGPEEPLYLKGLRAEIFYFKNALDKLNVTMDVEHAGKYKDFGDMFTRNNMSPETHEVIGGIVDELYGELVSRIATARKKTPEEVSALIDQGPFTSTGALKAGLVDELRFEDEMWGELRTQLKTSEPKKVPLQQYTRVPAANLGLSGSKRVAFVVAQGDILRGGSDDDGTGEAAITGFGFVKILRQVENDNNIKAVLVRIDSPGGDALASDEIWRAMNLLSKKKPMVISMSDLAASGGYYMAMTGDPIIAYPATETGSIGVVFGKPEIQGLLAKLGITADGIERGRNAGIDSILTPLTPAQRQILRDGIDESYHDFVAKVAQARRRPYNEVEPLAQGRVWLGSQAKARGLVDELGGLDTALAALKKKAGIPTSENVSLVTYPPRQSLLELIMKRSQDDGIESRLRGVFGRVPFRAWMKGGLLRLAPVWFDVR